MSIERNEELELVIEDGFLCVRIVDKGEYPWWKRTVMHEGRISIGALAAAIKPEILK
jgi:hypothetical protein